MLLGVLVSIALHIKYIVSMLIWIEFADVVIPINPLTTDQNNKYQVGFAQCTQKFLGSVHSARWDNIT